MTRHTYLNDPWQTHPAMTEAEIAAELKISRWRVQQLLERALRKLQWAIECEAAASGKTVAEWLREF